MISDTNTTKIRIFKFPKSQEQFSLVKNIQEIKAGLKMCQQLFDQFKISDIYNIMDTKTVNRHKIMAVCKYCKKVPSRIVWQKPLNSSQSFRLKEFQNQHEHTVLRKQIHKQILSLMSKSYTKVPINQIEEYCIRKFQINSQQFKIIKRYMLKKLYQKTFLDDLQQFRQNNILAILPQKLKIDPSTLTVTQFPQFLFAASKKMIRRFQHYGRVIFLHRIPYLIKKTANNLIDYFVLIVSGLNQFANIVFFGFAVVCAMTPQLIALTLQNLFKNSKNHICETIFSQNDPAFVQGIQNFINKSGHKIVHLWDLLLQIKQPDPQKKHHIKKSLTAPTTKQFITTITQYQKLRPQQSLKIEVFRKKSPKYCLSEIPSVFIGLAPPISHCSDIVNAVIKAFPRDVEYNRFVFKFFQFLGRGGIGRYDQGRVDGVEMGFVRDCGDVVSSQPFNHILNNLLSVLDTNISCIHQRNQLKVGQFTVTIQQTPPKPHITPPEPKFLQQATVPYSQINLTCTCMIKQKTGIPCSHIIRTCLHFGMPVSTQIDSFWRLGVPGREELWGDGKEAREGRDGRGNDKKGMYQKMVKLQYINRKDR